MTTRAMRLLSGVLYSTAGFILIMGILTAEMEYPSATIFDVTMLVAGVLILVATWVVWRHYHHRALAIASGLFGLGVFLVGVFPGHTGGTHALVAMIAFIFSGVTSITAFKVTSAPFRWMSLALGVVSLTFLVIGELGDSSAVAKSIGLGGVERWMVYPVVLWLPFFGGHLLASGAGEPVVQPAPGPVRERMHI